MRFSKNSDEFRYQTAESSEEIIPLFRFLPARKPGRGRHVFVVDALSRFVIFNLPTYQGCRVFARLNPQSDIARIFIYLFIYLFIHSFVFINVTQHPDNVAVVVVVVREH